MEINDFEPNSHKYNEQKALEAERPKIEAVATGTTSKRKRSLFRRFADTFFTEDVGDVKTYILYDVVIPAIKENVADIINSAVSMIFFGEASRRPRKPSGGATGSKINYGGYFNSGERKERMPAYNRSRIAHNFEDVVFDNRADAESVLDGMIEILNSEYRQVSVADFYDLAGISTSFTDNKYGWTDLRGARVVGSPSRGYIIELPRCVTLE